MLCIAGSAAAGGKHMGPPGSRWQKPVLRRPLRRPPPAACRPPAPIPRPAPGRAGTGLLALPATHPAAGSCWGWQRNTDRCQKKEKKGERTAGRPARGGERLLPAPRAETAGIAKPALQASAAGGNASASCLRKKKKEKKKSPELRPPPGALRRGWAGPDCGDSAGRGARAAEGGRDGGGHPARGCL